MHHRLLIIFVAVVSWFCSCCQSNKDPDEDMVVIVGLVNQPFSDLVVLQHYSNGAYDAIDTSFLSPGGGFFFMLEEHGDDFYALDFSNGHLLPLIIGDRDLSIKADFKNQPPEFSITGTTALQDVFVVRKIINFFTGAGIQNKEDWIDGQVVEDFLRIEPMLEGYDSLDIQSQQALKSALLNLDGRISALQIARRYLDVESHFLFYRQLYDQLVSAYPDSPLLDSLRERLTVLNLSSGGGPASDFNLPTPSGTLVRLTDLRDKVILVDFWAAWCKPCRENHPALRALYKKYQDRGLTIVGVSLDRDRNQWLAAIKEDSLEWLQVSDLLYFQSPVIKTFNIEFIPSNLLIDTQGMIIARNITIDSVASQLEKLLGH